LYSVKNPITGQVHSHHATRRNALAQLRLLHGIDHGLVPRRGGARVNPIVKRMYDYLSSLYPKKTLLSVANEIIKMSKGGGAGRASEIAKYVISAIGIALAVALAVFIQSQEGQSRATARSNPPSYDELYPNAPHHPPSYDDLYGPEPSAPPYEKSIGYAYGNESYSGRSSNFEPHYREPPSRTQHSKSHITHSGNVSMDYEPHYQEPPSKKGKSTHKIDVHGGRRRRRRHKKLY